MAIRRQPGVLALTFHLVQDRVSHITFRFYVGSGGSYLMTYACTGSACIHRSISPILPHPTMLQRAVFEEMKLEGKQSFKLLAVLNRGLLISKEMRGQVRYWFHEILEELQY